MNILVVDDEQDVKDLFQQKFRKEIRSGLVNFEFALSGEEALRILSRLSKEAILILSDINMPGMSGLELLHEIKSKQSNPPPVVMMVTAYGNEDNFNRAKELGADDFLTKPVDFNLLKDKLNIKEI
jgi:CheY-like chemotaxis protein